jgi:hypothetical protein
MAEMTLDPSGTETSAVVELIDDSTLVDFTGTPATSTIVHVKKIRTFSLFVAAVPETSQAIHLWIDSSPHNDQSVWYIMSDGNSVDVDLQPWIFKQATNVLPVELPPFLGATTWVRIRYGYVGGTGSGASLKVYVQGRAQ